MLTPRAQVNLNNAKSYFREHLCEGHYYAKDHVIAGEWFGVGAEQLGLKGKIGETEFLRMCEGLHPITGERLTLRMNTNRQDKDGQMVANRRVSYDFTISPPKSVSIVALLQDDRILIVHDRAVKLAMVELEKFAETRIRKAGKRSERVTGNIAMATFRHDASRELDPHLHTHCVVLNATFDPAENRWKALEVQAMYRAQKFAENLYYHELSKGLRTLGYEIENNTRDFEIKGVPASLITCFSKRHKQIHADAERQMARHGGDGNTVRRFIAQKIRKRKVKGSTAEKLRPSWMKQLDAAECSSLESLRSAVSRLTKKTDVASVVSWADEHLFERRSVVNDYELLSAALSRGRGHDFDLETLRAAVDQRGYIREEGTRKLTSQEVLRCELDIVMAARDGRFQHGPLSPGYVASPALSAEQRKAVEQILGSRNFISLFRGGAGTGKSFTLKEVQRGIVMAGHPVVVLAPQRQQVRDLEADGLPAETVARFFYNKQFPKEAVVIVDEAGQIGGKQLRELIQVVKANTGRLILSGDTRQHGAVAASDALKAIEKHAGIKPAVIETIRRQDPKLGRTTKERSFIRGYRAAVKAASKGHTLESFDQLDRLSCIREVTQDDRRDAVATEFMAASDRNEKALVVAQTREEVYAVNDAIRKRLRAAGKLGTDTTVSVLRPIDLGEAQKRDPRFYEPGQQVFFLKSYGRYKKGESYEIAGANERGLVIMKEGRHSTFSYKYTDRVVVASASSMAIATGDRLQLKFNGKSAEDAALSNGELVTVSQVRSDGALVVLDDKGTRKTLDASQRLFVRGYAVTSYASQGKTVDSVILSDAGNRAATNAEQWYVTISRGRKRAVVFTSDKEALRMSIAPAGNRELAMDLKPSSETLRQAVQQMSEPPGWTRQAMAAIARAHHHRFGSRFQANNTISKSNHIKL
ncbi:MAG: MobF family relaxase [Lacunisphaera sp.]